MEKEDKALVMSEESGVISSASEKRPSSDDIARGGLFGVVRKREKREKDRTRDVPIVVRLRLGLTDEVLLTLGRKHFVVIREFLYPALSVKHRFRYGSRHISTM